MRPAGIRVINVFPGPIDDEWNQLLPPPKLAPAALASAIVKALREGIEDVYPGDVAQEWLERWRDNPKALERELCRSMNALLAATAQRQLPSGQASSVVDLTQTLSPEFPQISLPPEMGQAWPFRIEEVSRYDERGPAWYWNNFSCGEHTGTHFDAPVHWVSGKDLPNNATDTIPPRALHRPGLRDRLLSKEAAQDAGLPAHRDHHANWEKKHGRIPPRAWVLMRTDWSKRAATRSRTRTTTRPASTRPGPDVEAVKFLVEERDMLGFGTESIGTDAGQAYHLRPPYPCHYFMHGAGRYGLQCLTNLDQLPPTGAVVVAAPLKIRNGSGSPLRVLASDGEANARSGSRARPTGCTWRPTSPRSRRISRRCSKPTLAQLQHHHAAGDHDARAHRVPHRPEFDQERDQGREGKAMTRWPSRTSRTPGLSEAKSAVEIPVLGTGRDDAAFTPAPSAASSAWSPSIRRSSPGTRIRSSATGCSSESSECAPSTPA